MRFPAKPAEAQAGQNFAHGCKRRTRMTPPEVEWKLARDSCLALRLRGFAALAGIIHGLVMEEAERRDVARSVSEGRGYIVKAENVVVLARGYGARSPTHWKLRIGNWRLQICGQLRSQISNPQFPMFIFSRICGFAALYSSLHSKRFDASSLADASGYMRGHE